MGPWATFAAVAVATAEIWLGHQTVWGSARVPLLGERTTRTDSFFLTHAEVSGTRLTLSTAVCHVDIGKVVGVRTVLPDPAAQALPSVTSVLTPGPLAGQWRGAWTSRWTAADEDRDGHPGVSVQVDVPLCGGSVYVAMRSDTRAEATFVGNELQGEVAVDFHQEVLSASNACLRVAAAGTRDQMHGVFRFRPAPAGRIDCRNFDPALWPLID